MRAWWADRSEEILYGMAHMAQPVISLQRGPQQPATNEGVQWTPVIRKSSDGPKDRDEQHLSTAIRENGTPYPSSMNAVLTSRSWAKVVNQGAFTP